MSARRSLGVVALLVLTGGCLKQPKIDAGSLKCKTDDNCLSGYRCFGATPTVLGVCVRSAPDGAVTDAPAGGELGGAIDGAGGSSGEAGGASDGVPGAELGTDSTVDDGSVSVTDDAATDGAPLVDDAAKDAGSDVPITGNGGASGGGGIVGAGGIVGSGGTSTVSASGGAGGAAAAGGIAGGGGGITSGGAVGTGGIVGAGGGTGAGGTVSTGGVAGMGGTAGSTGTGGNTSTGGSSPGGASGGTGGSASVGGSGGGANFGNCPGLPGSPTGVLPLPSPAQLAYQRTELIASIYFGMATYDGSEQADPSDPASMFNPTNLDATTAGVWASSLKAAGFGQAMLVSKHNVGFTLWPSKTTDYSVKNSPWMSGTGDIVQLFTDAMRSNGMRSALYLSPWDRKYQGSQPDYETYFENQLTEIFSYGPAYEIELDGYNAPTSGVNWKSVFQFVKQAHPNILIWAGPEIVGTGAIPDVQWIGNENGVGSRATSSLNTAYCGGGNTWCPFECNTSSHRPNWFWHPNSSPMALSDMQKVYFQTVGMNCTFNFNVPPSQTGEFDPKDLALLQQFGAWYSGLYKTNLLKGASATADSTWAAGFEVSKALDDDICSYWAAASGKTSARLEVTFASPVTASLISIREAIELGERVNSYHIEIKQNGSWNASPTDKSGKTIQGTVIGQRQLWQLGGTQVDSVALVIDSAKAVPAIAEFSLY